jgi:hypothetical protein
MNVITTVIERLFKEVKQRFHKMRAAFRTEASGLLLFYAAEAKASPVHFVTREALYHLFLKGMRSSGILTRQHYHSYPHTIG